MSDMEYKGAVRCYLPQLEGKTNKEAYEYFLEKLGKPKDYDEYGIDSIYFNYDDEKEGAFCPVQNYKTKEWYIDYVIFHDHGAFESNLGITLIEIKKIKKEIMQKFNFDAESFDKRWIKVVCYGWYNGCDEPFVF